MAVSSLLIAASLLKVTGKHALTALGLDEADGILGDSVNALLEPASDSIVTALSSRVARLNPKRTSREAVTSATPAVALLSVAWAEELEATDDGELAAALGCSSATEARRRVDAGWFVRVLTSAGSSTVGGATTNAFVGGTLSPSARAELASHIATEVIDEFGAEPLLSPPLVDAWVVQRIEGVVARATEIFRDLPEVQSAVLRADARLAAVAAARAASASDRAVQILEGAPAAAEAALLMEKICESVLQWANADLFRRESAGQGELPLLPASRLYVEPGGAMVLSGAHPVDARPVKALVRDLLDSPGVGLVVLRAPFGFGKSVTCRSLVLDLMREWRDSGGAAPFPLYLHCPHVLASHAGTVSAAVTRHLSVAYSASEAAIGHLFTKVGLIVVFDSFDEVEQSETDAKSWVADLAQYARGLRRIRVVLATRPHALEVRWLSPTDPVVAILPFDAPRVRAWLAAAAGLLVPPELTYEVLRARLDDEILGTPILLLMATWSWTTDDALRRLSKTELYQRFVDKIVDGKWTDVQPEHPVVAAGSSVLETLAGPQAYRLALGLTAWEHLKHEQRGAKAEDGLARRVVEDAIRTEFGTNRIRDIDVEAVTKAIVLSMFLRKAANEQAIVFSHRSFREYLCAELLVTRLLQEIERPETGFGRAALAEVALGPAETAFAADLIRARPLAEREAIASLLDTVMRDHRGLIVEEPGSEAHTWGRGLRVLLTRPDPDRRPAMRLNAELLDISSRHLGSVLLNLIRRRGAARVRSTLWYTSGAFRPIWPDYDARVVYARDDGQISVILPGTSRAVIEEFRSSCPNYAAASYREFGGEFILAEVSGELFHLWDWAWTESPDWWSKMLEFGRALQTLNAQGWELDDELRMTAWLDGGRWRFPLMKRVSEANDAAKWCNVFRYYAQNRRPDIVQSAWISNEAVLSLQRNSSALRGLQALSGLGPVTGDWDVLLESIESFLRFGLRLDPNFWTDAVEPEDESPA